MAESVQYSRSVLVASDVFKDIYCEPCGKDGLVVIAEGYCKDCHEYLCTQCYKTHRRNKMLANHVLLDKDSMPITSGSKKGVLDICEQKCTIHTDKVLEFYCETCDKLGCHVCVTLDHRQYEKVKHIPDIAKYMKHSQEFTKFEECIKSTTDKLFEFEQNLQANATSNNEMQTLAKQELKRQRAEVNKFFDELETKMDDRILILEKRNIDTLKKAFDKLKPMKKDLDQIKNDIEEKKSGQNCELFISMKKSNEKMRALDDQFNKLLRDLTIQHFTLLPSEQIQAMMRTTTEICKISTSRTTTEITSTSSTQTARINREVSSTLSARTSSDISRKPTTKTTSQFSGTPTARLESVIDIKTNKDKTKRQIFGLTKMRGYYCVVADNGNKCMKVVDTKSKQVASEMSIKATYIWSVTSVSDDQVVLSVLLSDNKNQIKFFTVSTSGVIQSTNQLYYVDDYYMGMVHCKGNIYGVKHGKIDILSMAGKTIRTIQTDDKGADLFGDLRSIALSPDGQTLYVTDDKKHSVTSLTLDGKVKAIFIDKELQRPSGITVDNYGNVYVRNCGTRNIQKFTADLNNVQILIEHVAGSNVTYSSTENKLYISHDDRTIKVYSLDYK